MPILHNLGYKSIIRDEPLNLKGLSLADKPKLKIYWFSLLFPKVADFPFFEYKAIY